ncbi:MAG: hypothetical protein EOO88_25820 [Pedobacter sp.]|nr:MAG: hypothetical protein EOO88_25820 [Pedobacter sp.]
MRKKCEGLSAQLMDDLEKVESKGLGCFEKLKAYLNLVSDCLGRMKELVLSDGFSSQAEEIEFFKQLKPKVYGLLVFASERYAMESASALLIGRLDRFYKGQLAFIARFFRQHEFMYQYYRLGQVEMDGVYFVRGQRPSGVLGIDVPELDISFSTYGDYLFAKFIGYERLQNLILSEMQGYGSSKGEVVRSKKGKSLKWTGDATNLIEILYGVFETKQFNQGEVDISDLVDVFSEVFEVNLSNYFQRFATIKRRKLVSKTRFLDQMRDAVAKRIDDADAYVPSWAK